MHLVQTISSELVFYTKAKLINKDMNKHLQSTIFFCKFFFY